MVLDSGTAVRRGWGGSRWCKCTYSLCSQKAKTVKVGEVKVMTEKQKFTLHKNTAHALAGWLAAWLACRQDWLGWLG